MVIRLRCRLILFVAFFSFALFSNAQETQSRFRELIVQVPGIAAGRGFPQIHSKLINIPGVRVVAYCATQQLIMMKLEKKKQPDNRAVFQAISQLEFRFNVKQDATISQALESCKDKSIRVYKYDDLPSE